jgi:hypothetical protein
LGFKDRQREQLLQRQAAYRRWVAEELGLPHLTGGAGAKSDPHPHPHPHLGWRYTLPIPVGPDGGSCDLHLIGLDSAWLAGDDADASQLQLTSDQVMRLTTDSEGRPLDGLRIALVHHPLDDLADGAECRRLLADHVDLLLRGHLHESEPNEWADPQRRLRQVTTGCLYEGHGTDQYPNACTVIEIGLDAPGDDGCRPLRYQLHFRGSSSRGHWFDDNGLYSGTKDGRLLWWVRKPSGAPALHPKVERLFVGREPEFKQMEAALLSARGETRPVAVCGVQGMPGVGKSYLLDADALTCGPTLVHIENVDSEAAAAIAVNLVTRLRGALLALSGRLQGLGEDAGWARVPLRPFHPANALEQLCQELGAKLTLDDSHRELVDALGWLPLAIHLAAGHLRRGRSVAGFLAKLRNRNMALAPADPADPGLNTDRARAILSATFDLSLELLPVRYLTAFHSLGHAPASGLGDSLGAALAELDAEEFEDLSFETAGLSLLDVGPGESIGRQRRWRVHPLLAEYLCQGSDHQSSDDGTTAVSRIGAWFLERLPNGGDWNAIHAEVDALIDWRRRVPTAQWVEIERAGSVYAISNGPFHVWAAFCKTALDADLDNQARSNLLWTLGNVAQRAGQLDQAMEVARQKADLDGKRGEDREVALAMGKVADIRQARGELDEALRIRREEELPVYEKLGDVRSLLVGRANLAIGYLQRGQQDDRKQANALLCLALDADRRLRLPEVQTIEGILNQLGFDYR